MDSTLTQLPAPHPAVVFRALPDGGVLFSTADEAYFGLNETGAFVWQHLRPVCTSLEALCARVAAEWPDADPADVQRDVRDLVTALVDNGLAVVG